TSLVPLVPAVRSVPGYVSEWQREFITNIGTVRPKYIVLSKEHLWWPFAQCYEDSAAHQVPGFDRVLPANYRYDTTIHGYRLYRLRCSPHARYGPQRILPEGFLRYCFCF